jgi:hypothetical protein
MGGSRRAVARAGRGRRYVRPGGLKFDQRREGGAGKDFFFVKKKQKTFVRTEARRQSRAV